MNACHWFSYLVKDELVKMAEKAIPLNVDNAMNYGISGFVSDKGQKSKRIGKAFINLDGKVPLSMTISLKALRSAIENKTITEQEYTANAAYPDDVLDGERVIRMAGFKITRKGSI